MGPAMIYTDSKSAQNSILSKIPKVRPPIPDDLGTMTMACILRNMVVANDVEGATAVIARMNGHRNPEGFTIQDVAGNGILQIAALKNLDSMTKRLLDQGLDINDVDNNHGTAVQAAIYMSHDKVLKVLLDENRTWLDVNTTGGYYGCALQVAAFKGSENYIKQLFRLGVIEDVCIAKSKYGTALQAAARTGLPSILELILRLKLVDVNAESGVYGTALQAAAKGDYTEAPTCLRRISRGRTLKQHTNPIVLRQTAQVRRKYLDVAQILLNRDAKVNAYGGRLRSPVNAAASSGQFEMLKLLLGYDESSPLEEKKAVYGRALLSAITQTFNENRLPLVKELIDRGADVNFAEGNGLFNRPLTAAAAMNDQEVVAYLLEISEDKKEFMDAESGIYGTALRAALSAPKPARNTVLYLIRQGANLSKGDQPYGNILHLATFANLNDIVEVLLDEYKVAVNALDMNDQTALHIAAYRGYEQVANTLLKRGANTDLRDVWGNTPLDVLEDVIGRESHPVPSLEGLRKIRKRLFQESVHEDMQRACRPFPGPLITRQSQDSKRARPVFDSPKWNPGLKFRATIVDFLEKGEQEYILVKDLQIDDLLYKKGALDETMGTMEAGYEVKLRWIHLPANNVCRNFASTMRNLLTYEDDLGRGMLWSPKV
jgi:ankyrin repeat protein